MTILQSISDLKLDHVYKWILKDDDSIVYEDAGVILNKDPEGTGISYKSEKDLTWYTNQEAKLSLKDDNLSPTKITLPKSAKSSLIHVGLVPPTKYKYAGDYKSDPWSKIINEAMDKYDINAWATMIMPLSKHEIVIGGHDSIMFGKYGGTKRSNKWYNTRIFDSQNGKIIDLRTSYLPSFDKDGKEISFLYYKPTYTLYLRYEFRENIEDVYLSPYVIVDWLVYDTLLLDEATIVEPEPDPPDYDFYG